MLKKFSFFFFQFFFSNILNAPFKQLFKFYLKRINKFDMKIN